MQQLTYQSPLSTRYASKEMSRIFSPQFKYSTWRKLWAALAEAQSELGLPISEAQIIELNAHLNDIDFPLVDEYEKQLHHDVMAHIHAYGDQCPEARTIIHLGATSCYVTDNTDIIQMKEALNFLLPKLKKVIQQLKKFALKNKDLACLGYTHFQPAQLTTVGKRTCLWIQDFFMDDRELKERVLSLRFLGAKGATGTQASFLALFDHDHEKVKKLDLLIAKKMGFDNPLLISGQTYTRKIDVQILSALLSFASSAHKFATDMRLLAHLKEVEEPFAEKQIGSSAMPYKRNPILSERICALSRFVIAAAENASYTAATQWLERSLDDSANRRLSIPEAFLAVDGILNLLISITAHLVLHPENIEKHVQEELPFMAMENILMAAVKKGGDRQYLHEKLRNYRESRDLLSEIAHDSDFRLNQEELHKLLDVRDFVGRAPQQVEEFLNSEVIC